jgi:DnaJ-class molecular chaperone
MTKTCPECHGTGECCYFKGESRFVLSHAECPACCGLGYVESEEELDGSESGMKNGDASQERGDGA